MLETYRFASHAKIQEPDIDSVYDADTEDIVQDGVCKRKLIKTKSRCINRLKSQKGTSRFSQLQNSVSEKSSLSADDNIESQRNFQISTDQTSEQTVLSDSELSERSAEIIQRETNLSVETTLKDLDMTLESIYNCQYADPQLKPIMDYLRKGILPQSQVKARSVLLQHQTIFSFKESCFTAGCPNLNGQSCYASISWYFLKH